MCHHAGVCAAGVDRVGALLGANMLTLALGTVERPPCNTKSASPTQALWPACQYPLSCTSTLLAF